MKFLRKTKLQYGILTIKLIRKKQQIILNYLATDKCKIQTQ
jgi:hypothetical protein